MRVKLLTVLITTLNFNEFRNINYDSNIKAIEQSHLVNEVEEQEAFIPGLELPAIDRSMLSTNSFPYNMVNYNVQT